MVCMYQHPATMMHHHDALTKSFATCLVHEMVIRICQCQRGSGSGFRFASDTIHSVMSLPYADGMTSDFRTRCSYQLQSIRGNYLIVCTAFKAVDIEYDLFVHATRAKAGWYRRDCSRSRSSTDSNLPRTWLSTARVPHGVSNEIG